ncbi:MFS transporter [Paenibacillus lautus]|uniref:MFS transporter n=1 Tax=Paenibacillus lautus TaxID=1401 RepID=A0A385TRA7_PAELA|nr:MFS transporter [Paenibacillus lautus]AYB45961.1 MFS transporter [Paenibacillus lautus]
MNEHQQPQQPSAEKLIRILAFTMILSSMSATMFNIVLPEISQDFQLSFAQVSWVSSIYMLIYAIGSVLYGKLADTYKLKNLVTFGLLLFFVGSITGLAAQAYWMVLLGRILQAAGAAVIPAIAMIIPVRYFPAENRGRALGITATGLAIGNAIGPVVSALVVSTFHWRWLFFIPLLILVTLPLYRKYLGNEQGQGARIDWLGGGLLAGTVALLLLAVTQGGWIFGVGSLILFLAFLLRIRSAKAPFVQPRLFRNQSYTVGLVLGMFIMSVGYALPFLTPQLLSDLNGLAPGWIGFVMVPGAVVTAMLGGRGGKLADTKGTRYLFYAASTLLLLCFALLSTFAGVSPLLIALFLIFGNVGIMFMQISLSKTISLSLPKEQTGVGMGLFSLLNFLSGAIATGVYGKAVDLGAGSRWNPLNMVQGASTYSNIYIVLVALQAGILLLFMLQFGRTAQHKLQVQTTGSK